jgi:photosystem II stability/assembly factor-like uncharacterized protein
MGKTSHWMSALLGSLLILQAQPSRSQSRVVDVGPFDRANRALPTFFSRTEGWAGQGNRALARTTDGGTTWAAVVPPAIGDDPTIEIRGRYFQSASSAWIGVAPAPYRLPDKGVTLFRTLDGGKTWAEQPSPGPRWTGDALFADIGSGSIWLGGEVATASETWPATVECPQRIRGTLWTPVIFYRGSSQSDWIQQSFPRENGCPVNMIRFASAKRGIAVSQNSVFYTDEAGTNWHEGQVSTPGAQGSWHKTGGSLPETLSFLEGSDQIAWLSYQDGAIFRTNDGGRHWDQIAKSGDIWKNQSGFGEWGAVYFASEMVGWTLGGDGEIFETRDGGLNWSKLEVPDHVTGLSGAQGSCWATGQYRLYRIEWR